MCNAECQRCGKANQENPKCPNNLCCSTSEFCGDTGEHCLTFCNPKYGRCDPFKGKAITCLLIAQNDFLVFSFVFSQRIDWIS